MTFEEREERDARVLDKELVSVSVNVVLDYVPVLFREGDERSRTEIAKEAVQNVVDRLIEQRPSKIGCSVTIESIEEA